MKILQKYKNGDTFVTLFDNGTRIMDNKKDEPFNLAFPVSVDLNISNYCLKGCPYCYQNCTANGDNADVGKMVRKLHKGMEVAININTGYPIDLNFVDALEYCRDNSIIVNATINQDDYEDRKESIMKLQEYDLLHGIGISMTKMTPIDDIDNVVFHTIAGLVTIEQLQWCCDNNYNVLILGYKQKGRAKNDELPNMDYLIKWLEENLNNVKNVICFDNLAIEQLGMKSLVAEDMWATAYQGDEGTISMYIDGVNETFARNSFSNINYDMNDMNIEEMFEIIKENR